jgi:hypothetical protein
MLFGAYVSGSRPTPFYPAPAGAGAHTRNRRGAPPSPFRALAWPTSGMAIAGMTTILRREGNCLNNKRIQGLCRDEGRRVLN